MTRQSLLYVAYSDQMTTVKYLAPSPQLYELSCCRQSFGRMDWLAGWPAGVSLSHNLASNKLTQVSSLLLTIKENKGCIRQCNVSCKLPRNTILTQVLNETLHSVTYFITAKILSCGGRCRAESDEVLLFEELVPR